MGFQVALRKLPREVRDPVFSRTLCLEDVLVSTVFGALDYGPAAMFAAWRRRFTTLRPPSPDIRLEFWPTKRVGRRILYPDLFIVDEAKGQLLVVEAKRDPRPLGKLVEQVTHEGRAAKVAHNGLRRHLLVVSDHELDPWVFEELKTRAPRMYGSRTKHATWAEICCFLRDWRRRHDCDPGQKRMIDDALKVMTKYDRGCPAANIGVPRRGGLSDFIPG